MNPSSIIATSAALADRTRLLALFVLGAGPLTIGRLAEQVHVTSASASYHVAKLQRAGLVGVQRVGRRSLVRRVEQRWTAILGAFSMAE
ncbi:MAG TPA: MarR family transcriptional regulator [Polyangiaceae bacterium]|nr:MarR family transcriptional regulator [Polyangiaceae bacterium]